MKMKYYSGVKMRYYGGEKSLVMAEMIPYLYSGILDTKD